MKTPFFGPFDVTRSQNLADNELINLRPEIAEGKDGKNIGALMGTPGLDLLLTTTNNDKICGLLPFSSSVLYAVSGEDIYTVTTAWGKTLVDTIVNTMRFVSMITNGTQMLIATDLHIYVGPVGFQSVSQTINTKGINYGAGDVVVMQSDQGGQTAALIISVNTVDGVGGVLTYTVEQQGAFSPKNSSFSQQTTTGSGSGLILTPSTWSAAQHFCDCWIPGFTPAGGQTMSVTFQDGFGLLNQVGSNKIWQSAVDDISVWPALNFAEVTAEAGNVQAVVELHRLIFVIKDTTTEVWNDVGTGGFAFSPIQSILIEHGTPAWATVKRVGESLCMLTQSREGHGIVREIIGFTPNRISTNAVEYAINKAYTLTDAYAYYYKL